MTSVTLFAPGEAKTNMNEQREKRKKEEEKKREREKGEDLWLLGQPHHRHQRQRWRQWWREQPWSAAGFGRSWRPRIAGGPFADFFWREKKKIKKIKKWEGRKRETKGERERREAAKEVKAREGKKKKEGPKRGRGEDEERGTREEVFQRGIGPLQIRSQSDEIITNYDQSSRSPPPSGFRLAAPSSLGFVNHFPFRATIFLPPSFSLFPLPLFFFLLPWFKVPFLSPTEMMTTVIAIILMITILFPLFFNSSSSVLQVSPKTGKSFGPLSLLFSLFSFPWKHRSHFSNPDHDCNHVVQLPHGTLIAVDSVHFSFCLLFVFVDFFEPAFQRESEKREGGAL